MNENEKQPIKSQKIEKATEKGTKTKKSTDKNSDFKRKYFEYYDDIKISDRQDW